MRITTKIIMAIALATAGLGYFQIVGAGDRAAPARSVTVMKRSAETVHIASEQRRTPVFAATHR